MKNKLPSLRTNNIVVQNLDGEVLVYDLTINKAFCLNLTSTLIYQACGQNKSFAEIMCKYEFTEELIFYALDQFQKNNLLNSEINYNASFEGLTRREVIRKIGLTSMVALPVISSLVAPSAINAASGATCGTIAPEAQVGPTRWTSRGSTCQYPDPVIDRNCNTTFGNQCISCKAAQNNCIQDTRPRPIAVYNCKCIA